ncbi:hypothetical protein AGDE_15095 [Angomonas deanei]|uniref:Uncharacterized protein n=1 Tax=Angomonas deanei TaxID=59799 RepID=A0A7G2CRQ3_9TRYP|nr:hypothetical protein AGDE_15095 [Angomonas deanei]CAD2222195.1 hypothetical protein, conserved [Angomonas deanei]|eukprot:EPY19701.1 hypothetical protein AGDE_15095 [Angomonas deanei]
MSIYFQLPLRHLTTEEIKAFRKFCASVDHHTTLNDFKKRLENYKRTRKHTSIIGGNPQLAATFENKIQDLFSTYEEHKSSLIARQVTSFFAATALLSLAFNKQFALHPHGLRTRRVYQKMAPGQFHDPADSLCRSGVLVFPFGFANGSDAAPTVLRSNSMLCVNVKQVLYFIFERLRQLWITADDRSMLPCAFIIFQTFLKVVQRCVMVYTSAEFDIFFCSDSAAELGVQ